MGVGPSGASASDAKDISTYAFLFSVSAALHITQAGMEAAGNQDPADRQTSVETMTGLPDTTGQRKTHRVFGQRFISSVQGDKLMRVHSTRIADSLYPDAVDDRTSAF